MEGQQNKSSGAEALDCDGTSCRSFGACTPKYPIRTRPMWIASVFSGLAFAGMLLGLAGCTGNGRSFAAPAPPVTQSGSRHAVHSAGGKGGSNARRPPRLGEKNVPHSARDARRAEKGVHAAKDAAQKHTLDLVGKLNGRGWYLPWYKRDPKHPNGPPMPVLLAEAETGEIVKRSDNPAVVMHHVHAKLFQKGVHAANIVANKVRADEQAEKVFAIGNCKVTSLLNPSDTVLTADRITWDTANSRLVAEGHAHVERKPRNGGVPMSQDGGRIVFDLEHNTVTIL